MKSGADNTTSARNEVILVNKATNEQAAARATKRTKGLEFRGFWKSSTKLSTSAEG